MIKIEVRDHVYNMKGLTIENCDGVVKFVDTDAYGIMNSHTLRYNLKSGAFIITHSWYYNSELRERTKRNLPVPINTMVDIGFNISAEYAISEAYSQFVFDSQLGRCITDQKSFDYSTLCDVLTKDDTVERRVWQFKLVMEDFIQDVIDSIQNTKEGESDHDN